MYVRAYVRVYVRMYVCTCVRMYVCTCVRACVCACVHDELVSLGLGLVQGGLSAEISMNIDVRASFCLFI